MSDDKLYDVFLSHNGHDKESVEELAGRLEDEAQLKPWLDKWNLVPGEPWQEALELALDSSRTCAVFLGPSGIGPWQNEEMRAALQERVSQRDFRVIPVLLPGALAPDRKQLPRFLSRLTWVDFRGPKGLKDELAFRSLVSGVRGHAPGRHAGAGKGLPDDAKESKQQRRKGLLIILTAFMVVTAINLLADIVQRFLSGGSDWVSIVRNFIKVPLYVVQTALLLLASGTLVEPSQRWVAKLLTHIGLYKKYEDRKRLLISAVALALVLAARLSLPFVAGYYNERGARAVSQGDMSSAAYYYQRAISLNPDYAQAHYGLANVYEDLQKYNDAITEYSQAIRLDSRFGHARNNLARLYLRRGQDKDYEDALQMINEELSRSPTDVGLQYSLYKNRGWANYELKNYQQAENDLRRAIMLREDGAAAHCLLGYVLEAQKKPDADDEWFDCVRYEPEEKDVEAKWLGDAREKIIGESAR
jgi:tetratricopeptide (TPR) repeat protein